jgi:hypothetical protein
LLILLTNSALSPSVQDLIRAADDPMTVLMQHMVAEAKKKEEGEPEVRECHPHIFDNCGTYDKHLP